MVDATQSALEKSLDLAMRKHALHSSNIANANVPDFKAKKIDFADRLQGAMESMDAPNANLMERNLRTERAINQVEPDVYADPLAPMKGDGNTVNVDREQTELAKNTIQYEGAIQLLNKKLALQKYVLSEGGR